MSGVSKGSQTATNTFIVLGLAALVALALATDYKRKNSAPAATCAERLVSMGPIIWDPTGPIPHPGEPQFVTLDFTVDAEGTVTDVRVNGAASEFDDIARSALLRANYRSDESAADLLCSHTFRLQID